MTKSNITQYDNVAANNTDVEDVPLGENLMFPADVNNAFREVMADLADVNDGTVSLTSPSAVSLGVTGNITVGGTVDGRDVATDGTKLDGIEALADVTDTANVTSAGAAMLTGATFTGSITAPDATFNGDLNFNSGYGSAATAYGCRAWVNFDGTGVVSIRESGNVSSITDNATGDYRVNFTTAMADTNYAVVNNAATSYSTYSVVTSGTMRGSSSAATAVLQIHNVAGGTPTTPQLMTTTAVRLGVKASTSTTWDIPVGTVAILR